MIETFNIFTLDPIWATIQQFNLSVYNFIYVIVHRSVFPVFNLTKAKPKYPILYLFQINKSSIIELNNFWLQNSWDMKILAHLPLSIYLQGGPTKRALLKIWNPSEREKIGVFWKIQLKCCRIGYKHFKIGVKMA